MGLLVPQLPHQVRQYLVQNEATGAKGMLLGGALFDAVALSEAEAKEKKQGHWRRELPSVSLASVRTTFPVGSRVQLRADVEVPRHGWPGAELARSAWGLVVSNTENGGAIIRVNFPGSSFNHWGIHFEELCPAWLPAPTPFAIGQRVRLAPRNVGADAALAASAAEVLEGGAVGVVLALEGAPTLDFLLSKNGHSTDIVCAAEEAFALLQRAASAEEARKREGAADDVLPTPTPSSPLVAGGGGGDGGAPPPPPPRSRAVRPTRAACLADAQPSRETSIAQGGTATETGVSSQLPPEDLFYSATAGCERRASGGPAFATAPSLLRSTLGPYFATLRGCLATPPPPPTPAPMRLCSSTTFRTC